MKQPINLLQKYDVPGPRYTSYPTAPAWTETVGPEDFAHHLGHIKTGEPLSLYFHIPFCEKLCHFCGCLQVITRDRSRSRPYMDALCHEMELVARHLTPATRDQRPVVQIHFGGGTPNFLKPVELSRIMQKTRSLFHVDSDAEISIEMHPQTSTREFCNRLKKEGFNRISLGVQDFDDEVQRLIHRFQTYAATKDMLSDLRKIGFRHFNFDLIYGLPGQTLARFQDTLKKVIALKPNRLAVYSYAHVPWARPVQRSFKDADLPSPHLKLKLFLEALRELTGSGYTQIGMDHFADENDELSAARKNKTIHRNFMGYSTRADAHQIGFGLSSISFVNGHYFQNTKKISDYQALTAAGQLATHRGFLLSRDDALRRAVIAQLMCHGNIDIPAFERAHGLSFPACFEEELAQLKPLQNDGLVNVTPHALTITPTGRLVTRNIAMCFDRYLDRVRVQAQNPVFSRTV